MKRSVQQEARIAWRRGQWATVDAFLRGEGRTRKVGPGMAEPEDGTSCATEFLGDPRNDGRVPESPRLDELERRQR